MTGVSDERAIWLGRNVLPHESALRAWLRRRRLEGLEIDLQDLESLQSVDAEAVKAELLSQEELFLKLAGDLPKEMVFQRELLISRL